MILNKDVTQSLYLAISILLLLLLPATWDLIDPTAKIIALFLLLLILVSWLFVAIRVRHLLTLPSLILPFSLYSLLNLGFLVNSPLPVYSIYWVLSPVILLLIFVFVIDSHNYGWKFRTWENAVILVALVMAAIDLLLVAAWYFTWWDISGAGISSPPYSVRSPGGLLGHPNYMAGYMNLVIPFVILRLARSSTTNKRILWAIILVMFLSVIFFTSSRGGWLGLICGLVGMWLMYFAPKFLVAMKANATVIQHLRITKRRALVIICSLFLITIVVVFAIPQIQRAAHGSVQGRFAIWQNSVEMILESPWFGNGPGSYPLLYASSDDGFGRTYLVHAHNIFLQIASNMGVIGLFLITWMVFLIGKHILEGYKLITLSQAKRDYLLAYCGLGVALIVHNQVDFLFYKYFISMNVIIFTGLLFWGKIEARKIRLKTLSLSLIMAICLLVILIGGYFTYLGGRNIPAFIKYVEESKWSEANQELCQYTQKNPAYTYNSFQCGLINAIVSFNNNDKSKLLAAIDYTRSGLERDPYWFLHWANLASYEWQLGKTNLAIEHLLIATDFDPYRDFLWLNLGIMLENIGQDHEAITAYGKAVCLNPWYKESYIIEKSPLYEKTMSFGCKDALLPDTTEKKHRMTLWESREAYLAGEIIGSENLIFQSLNEAASNPLAYAYLAQLAFENGDIGRSKSYIDTAIFISNNQPEVLLIAGILYRHFGDEDLGYEYLKKSYYEYRYRRYSNGYYADAYRQYSLPVDVSPYLYIGDLTEENVDTFTDLIEYLETNDNSKLANDIRQWLDWNKNSHKNGS